MNQISSIADRQAAFVASIPSLIDLCHGASKAAGWWHDLHTGEPLKRNDGEMLMLMVSEISEGMEGHRKNLMDDKLPHRKMLEVELADALVRGADYLGGKGEEVEYSLRTALLTNDPHPPSDNVAECLLWCAAPLLGYIEGFWSTTSAVVSMMVRVHRLALALGLDVIGALREKVEFNRNRADHKPENRRKEGGKAY